jgi:hypothetical protein
MLTFESYLLGLMRMGKVAAGDDLVILIDAYPAKRAYSM